MPGNSRATHTQYSHRMEGRLGSGGGEDGEREKERGRQEEIQTKKRKNIFLPSTEFMNHSSNNFRSVFLDNSTLYTQLGNEVDNFELNYVF